MYKTTNCNFRFAGLRRLLPIHDGVRQLQAKSKRQVGSIQGSLVLPQLPQQHKNVAAQFISALRQTWPGNHVTYRKLCTVPAVGHQPRFLDK